MLAAWPPPCLHHTLNTHCSFLGHSHPTALSELLMLSFSNAPSLPLPLPQQLESPWPHVPTRGVKGHRAPCPYEFSRFGQGGTSSPCRAETPTASSFLRLCLFPRPPLPIPASHHCLACPFEPVLGTSIASSSSSMGSSTMTLLTQRRFLRVQSCWLDNSGSPRIPASGTGREAVSCLS